MKKKTTKKNPKTIVVLGLIIAQAIIWAGVYISTSLTLAGTEFAKKILLAISSNAFVSILITISSTWVLTNLVNKE